MFVIWDPKHRLQVVQVDPLATERELKYPPTPSSRWPSGTSDRSVAPPGELQNSPLKGRPRAPLFWLNESHSDVPVETTDPSMPGSSRSARDRIAGFLPDPPRKSAVSATCPWRWSPERLRAMLSAGVIRRIRQTLLATNLADGACARGGALWNGRTRRSTSSSGGSFSGHVVTRSTDAATPG